MNSLKHNDIELSDNKLVSILYDIELTSKLSNLFLINAGEDLTLLMGYLDNRIFTLAFYENKWMEYFLFNHNYNSIMKFGNINNPYLTFEAYQDNYESIISNDESLTYNKFPSLSYRFRNMFLKDSKRFAEIMNRGGNVQLVDIYDILIDYEIIKEGIEEK
jgi:hypothetical protein